jgi:hypothetical protein
VPEQYQFIYEHPAIAELGAIEPDALKQMYLTTRIETACAQQIAAGIRGYGFARVHWKHDLIAWYHESGTLVYPQSVKYDLIAVPIAA